RGGRADARDGALEAPRGGAALREPRGGRSREPGRAPRPGGGAQLPAAEGGHGPARQRGLRDAARGARAPLAQGRAQDRAARAARHLPGAAPRPPRRAPDRSSRLDRPPPRGDQALPARRSAGARSGAHLEESAHPAPGHAARRSPRGLRGARRRAHHHHFDRPPPRHELVDVVGGAVSRRGIVINTFMLDDSPSLRAFVERMTRINKGRALYTRPDRLGEYLLVDYIAKKRKRV